MGKDPEEVDLRLPTIGLGGKQQDEESPWNPIFGFGEWDGIRQALKKQTKSIAS